MVDNRTSPDVLRAKGAHNRDGTPNPSTTQQWAMLDVALERFGEEMLAEGVSHIVRSRTDLILGSPAPLGSPYFRYAALATSTRPNAVCANTDRLFYADFQTFTRVFRSMWWYVNTMYGGRPTPEQARLLAERISFQVRRQNAQARHKQVFEALRVGCNVIPGHNYAWRKLPPDGGGYVVRHVPNWTRAPADVLFFHSEQAFTFHVMATMRAACDTCAMIRGSNSSVYLMPNRSACTSVPVEHSNVSNCGILVTNGR